MMPIRHLFSAFAPGNTLLLGENKYNYIRSESLNPPFHYPRTHDSNIPEFQHSNWAKPLTPFYQKAHPAYPEILFPIRQHSSTPLVLIQDPLWGQTKAGPSELGFFTK
jgi:hypothetical protein